MPDAPLIHLASQSPRRRELLARLGIPFSWSNPGLDDAELALHDGSNPSAWVGALAYLKARSWSDLFRLDQALGPRACGPLVIGADTVCVNQGRVLGQPRDAGEAAAMIRAMSGRSHDVLTGVALLRGSERSLFVERVVVEVGVIPESEIELYVSGDGWRGKAGAYNLSERASAGWPVRALGSASSVMGLPIERLLGHAWIQELRHRK